MRKVLSLLLAVLLPLQGMLGHAMAMQMELAKVVDATVLVAARGQPADVSAAMDCEMMVKASASQDSAADLASDGCCPFCADCPLCHLLAAASASPVAPAAQVWGAPQFAPLPLLGVVPLPSTKPPIFQV